MPDFGEIVGCPVGATFSDRQQLSRSGVHRPTQAGIGGTETEGADSIVLSGGYEDDIDEGDLIIYTGQGGGDPQLERQIAHQEFRRGNRALARSCDQGLPVRVIRGSETASSFSPSSGYRYDGLYHVEDYWKELGQSGFLVWRYRLRRDDSTPAPWSERAQRPEPHRHPTTVQRIVRNTAAVTRVKELHRFRCQVCGVRLETPSGPYAEGAHVRPLGAPHDGPDIEENILCLCPNHHVLFDRGAITLADDLTIIGLPEAPRLRMTAEHPVDVECVRYHQGHYGHADMTS